MTIKHLVIGGGGPLGLKFLGALQKLEEEGFWKKDDIESIYGTSIGSIIGAFICLGFDKDTLNKYIIERPWHDAFSVNPKQIFDSYYNKGLFDKTIIEILFKPLLKAKDLSLDISLEDFYKFSKIDFHIFTFELNNFETVELSFTTHPNLSLIEALMMSSSLPGIFMPTIIDNKCYIDGGVMCDYPINECLKNNLNKDEILGIKAHIDNENENFKNIKITKETTLLEYVVSSTLNTMNFIRNCVNVESIDNTVKCCKNVSVMSLKNIQESLKNQNFRREWLIEGEEDAIHFLDERKKINLDS